MKMIKKKRKKELSQKNWNSESKQRQMIIKQKIFAISTMSCKNPWNKEP